MNGRVNQGKPSWAIAIVVGAIVGTVLLLIAEGVLFAWLGLSHRHVWPAEDRLGNAVVALSARWHGGERSNPIPESPTTLALGQTSFRNCVQCHGAGGQGDGDLGKSLFPPVPSLLSASTKSMSDAQLFWIIKNGLSFTAMPAYQPQYRDDTIWATVQYIRALQQGRALAFGPPAVDESDAQRAANQSLRSRLTLSDSGMQPATLSVHPGTVEFDVTNQSTRGHQIVVSGAGKVPFNAGRLLPTQSLQLRGQLDAGDYQIAVDPGSAAPGPVTTVTVR